ncbi:MAG: radical SAM protein [Methanosarcinales archaeon]|nr:radical SAM protein [Methanosarcinales archaeon]
MIIAWEVTGACNLACSYCRASATGLPDQGELSTKEALAFLDQVSVLQPMIILSGGEPLLRGDIFRLASHAAASGIRVSLATNGTFLTPKMAKRISACGIARVSVSLDGATAGINDATRGEGSFDAALRGISCLKGKVGFQINMTLTRRNEHQVAQMLDLAEELGAKAVHFFFMVPTGRGRDEEMISPQRQEEILCAISREMAVRDLEIQVTCAPQMARMQAEDEQLHRGQREERDRGRRRSGGCLGGIGFAFVSRSGDVYPCGYLPAKAGNIREQSFQDIWEDSPVLKALRERELKGRCGDCGYRKICGGCRARAYAATGDFLESDPLCTWGGGK